MFVIFVLSCCVANSQDIVYSYQSVVQNVVVDRTIYVPVRQQVVVPIRTVFVTPVVYYPVQPVYYVAPVVVYQQPVVVEKRCWAPFRY